MLAARAPVGTVLVVWAVAVLAAPQQRADPDFDVSVPHPAYTDESPRVVIDEAHRNFHTAGGRYRPLAQLLENDGYDVQPGTEPFSAASLEGVRVLIVSNALGPDATAGADTSSPAFTAAECDAVVGFVRGGGSLLLVSDHTPFGAAAAQLAARFGATMGRGFVQSRDPRRHMPGQPHQLLFSRDNGALGDHAITRGRDDSERINAVTSFTGQSITIPEGSSVLLALGSDSWEAPTRGEARLLSADAQAAGSAAFTSEHGSRVESRAQGIALLRGAGRVVILGEAAMLTAQVTARADGSQGRMGMNVPGNDDRQFALNVLHWLSGLF
jgi:hypothetical protein